MTSAEVDSLKWGALIRLNRDGRVQFIYKSNLARFLGRSRQSQNIIVVREGHRSTERYHQRFWEPVP